MDQKTIAFTGKAPGLSSYQGGILLSDTELVEEMQGLMACCKAWAAQQEEKSL